MTPMVNTHGLSVDDRRKRLVGVGQGRQGERGLRRCNGLRRARDLGERRACGAENQDLGGGQ